MEYKCLYDEIVDPKTLKQHVDNANKHSPEQIDRIVKILHYQGWRYAIKISKQSGMITSGNGRAMAGIKMGCLVPVVYQDYKDYQQELSDVHADNAIASWAELDRGIINSQMDKFGPDYDLDLLGMKDFTLDLIEKLEPGCDEDAVPEVKETTAKLGDLFELGEHRLICGDSTDILQVERLMNGQKADMVFTDPPYGVDYDGGVFSKREKLDNDHDESIYMKVMPVLAAVTHDHAAFFIWYAMSFSNAVSAAVSAAGLLERKCIIWNKNMAQFGAIGAQYKDKYEPVLYCYKKNKKPQWFGPTNEVSVWDIKRSSKNEFHPTQKPIELAERAFNNHTLKDQIILDLFGGSGSTLIAAEKLNRKAYLCELKEQYVDVIIQRWQKFSNKKAYLINEDGSKTLYDELKSKNENLL